MDKKTEKMKRFHNILLIYEALLNERRLYLYGRYSSRIFKDLGLTVRTYERYFNELREVYAIDYEPKELPGIISIINRDYIFLGYDFNANRYKENLLKRRERILRVTLMMDYFHKKQKVSIDNFIKYFQNFPERTLQRDLADLKVIGYQIHRKKMFDDKGREAWYLYVTLPDTLPASDTTV